MQKRISTMIVIVVFICGSNVFADENNKRKMAEDLLLQMGMNKNSEMMMSQIAKMQENTFASMGIEKDKDTKRKEFMDKMWKLITTELSWERMKEDFIKIYADVFTEGELNDLINFYKSPAGVKYIEKMPELMKKSFEISQARTQKLLPELKKLIEESVEKK